MAFGKSVAAKGEVSFEHLSVTIHWGRHLAASAMGREQGIVNAGHRRLRPARL